LIIPFLAITVHTSGVLLRYYARERGYVQQALYSSVSSCKLEVINVDQIVRYFVINDWNWKCWGNFRM